MKTLQYAELGNKDDIRGIEFDELKDLTSFVYDNTLNKDNDRVYLITFNMGGDCTSCPIFINEDAVSFIALIASSPSFYEEIVDDYFLYECETYRDAYELALLLKELNPLCEPSMV